MAARPWNETPAQRAERSIDARLATLAGRELGLFTAQQIFAAGLSSSAKGRRVHRMHRGVYLYGNPEPGPGAKELAAALATAGVVSDRSATSVWQLLPPWPGDVHVTVPPDSKRRSRDGIFVHRRHLEPHEIRHRGPIPVTSPLRTIQDLPKALRERATNEALVKRLIRPEDLAEPRSVTESHAERRLLPLLRRAGSPPDATNVTILGYEVDCVWRAAKLVVEVDGHSAHATPGRFEADHRRDLALEAAGWRVLRVSWRQIRDDPDTVATVIARAAARA